MSSDIYINIYIIFLFPRTCNIQLSDTDLLYFRIIPAVTKALVERLAVPLFFLKNGELAFHD